MNDHEKQIKNNVKYNKNTKNNSKPSKSTEITHTDFMNFIQPYCEPVKYLQYIDFVKKTFNSSCSDIEKNANQALVKKLLCYYQFNGNIDISNVNYEKELVLSNILNNLNIKLPEFLNEENKSKKIKIFDNISTKSEYEKILINNKKLRLEIKNLIVKRSNAQAYFEIHGMMHNELENVYKKMIARHKKKNDAQERETINEYLKRIEKFYELFGSPEQFPYTYYVYPDVLSRDPYIYLEKEYKYFS